MPDAQHLSDGSPTIEHSDVGPATDSALGTPFDSGVDEHTSTSMRGYRRSDGRIGIRNVVAVVYLVECARHVATRIVNRFDDDSEVHLIGFSGCYRNDYAFSMLSRLGTHPNVGAVLLVSLGCEGFDRERLEAEIERSGRPVNTLVIQRTGGTQATFEAGVEWVTQTVEELSAAPTEPMSWNELVVGTICGGSDSTSGLTANPAVGVAFDYMADRGSAVIFEETGELMGCENAVARRAVDADVAARATAAIAKASTHYADLGQPSFAPGNAEGGLTTIEEKSLGSYAKSGSRPIVDVIIPGQLTNGAGVYLLDVIPDGPTRWGFANIVDNAEIGELIACGAHVILFTTGRGSVVGSAISPVIKVCANPDTFDRMRDDMDIDAGRILNGEASLGEVGHEIVDAVEQVASGKQSRSEALGHREFIMTYKSFDRSDPSCHTGS